jgi:response regulator RpfG family c-di-GMP phosphodiesterase
VNNKVLFVDDDDNLRASVQRTLRNRFDLELVPGGLQGLRAMEERGPFAVVVADLAMPGMNGIEFLRQAHSQAPDTVRIMFSGHPGPVALMEAINSGQVFRFVSKPCQMEELARAVEDGLRQHHLANAERELLEATLTLSLQAMIGMLELLDPTAFSFAKRLSDRAAKVAQSMGVDDAWAVVMAASFSPLWTLTLPEAVRSKLAKGAALNSGEEQQIALAIRKAADLVEGIPRLKEVGRIIRFHPKGFDGTGFPEGPMRGEGIPIGSRILKALTDFNAIESRVKSREVALEDLRLQKNVYDPLVIAAMASVFDVPLHQH